MVIVGGSVDDTLSNLIVYTDLDASDVQLDTTLVEDNSDNDSDSESETNEVAAPNDASDTCRSSKPTIELKVALGAFDESPGMAVSGNDEDTSVREQKKQDSSVPDEKSCAKSVSEALKRDDNDKATSESSSKKRKLLIQELS